MFPNNKPWLKNLRDGNKLAFLNGDTAAFYIKTRELRLKKQKLSSKTRLKVSCTENPHLAWEGLNEMMGRVPKSRVHSCSVDSFSFANNLNPFMLVLILRTLRKAPVP